MGRLKTRSTIMKKETKLKGPKTIIKTENMARRENVKLKILARVASLRSIQLVPRILLIVPLTAITATKGRNRTCLLMASIILEAFFGSGCLSKGTKIQKCYQERNCLLGCLLEGTMLQWNSLFGCLSKGVMLWKYCPKKDCLAGCLFKEIKILRCYPERNSLSGCLYKGNIQKCCPKSNNPASCLIRHKKIHKCYLDLPVASQKAKGSRSSTQGEKGLPGVSLKEQRSRSITKGETALPVALLKEQRSSSVI